MFFQRHIPVGGTTASAHDTSLPSPAVVCHAALQQLMALHARTRLQLLHLTDPKLLSHTPHSCVSVSVQHPRPEARSLQQTARRGCVTQSPVEYAPVEQ